MKKLLIFNILIFVSVSFAFSQHNNLSWLDGVWVGKGFQPFDDAKWNINLVYQSNSEKITVTYPSLKCIGEWKLVQCEKNRAEFVEKIVKGECDNDVKVIVTLIDEKTISVAYFLPQIVQGIIAIAALEKQ